LQESELNLNPSVDSGVIRIPVPPLSEDRRRELVKLVNRHLEEARQSVRNVRRGIMDQVERQKEDSEISEDDFFRLKKQIQEEVDEANEEIKEIGERKESELMRI
jgi:ribosome recycling factor